LKVVATAVADLKKQQARGDTEGAGPWAKHARVLAADEFGASSPDIQDQVEEIRRLLFHRDVSSTL
jgi:hypothetical protein